MNNLSEYRTKFKPEVRRIWSRVADRRSAMFDSVRQCPFSCDPLFWLHRCTDAGGTICFARLCCWQTADLPVYGISQAFPVTYRNKWRSYDEEKFVEGFLGCPIGWITGTMWNYSIIKETLYSQLTIRSYIIVLQTGQNSKQSILKLHCSMLLSELKTIKSV